jgi:hypothetical protein
MLGLLIQTGSRVAANQLAALRAHGPEDVAEEHRG